MKFEHLPKTSGVYIFKNGKELLYIGKAANIRERVKNHFKQPSYRDNIFIHKVKKIDFTETNSEIEALILEAGLIKKYQPKYNVMWRDDKNYFYVAIGTNEKKLPYIYITHQKNDQGTEYIGPFVEGVALKKTLRFLRRIFPYYSIRKHPKTKCTYCHLDLCPGPEPDGDAYKKNIKKLILILRGKRNIVLNSLKKEMKYFSKEKKFEEAGKIRDRIYNLQQVISHTRVISSQNSDNGFLPYGKKPFARGLQLLQKIIGAKNTINRIECYDVSNMQGKEATGSMVVFINGAPDKSQYKKFKIRRTATPNDIAMLKETVSRRLAHADWEYPEIILVDGGKGQLNAAIACKPKASNIKIISLAKGKQDPLRPRPASPNRGGSEARLFIEGRKNPVPLKSLPREIYNLIKYLDDEAHRFAISYHKTLRVKKLLQ